MRPVCWLVLLLAVLQASRAAGQGPWQKCGGAGSEDGFWQMIEAFAVLPPAQQQAILFSAGMVLQSKTGMDCNIFAPPSMSCKALPTNTSYVQQCADKAQRTVDCAFYEEVVSNVYDSPVDNLAAYLTQLQPGLPDLCPQCFTAVQDLWCALAAPTCGTFGSVVRSGLLPILSQAIRAYQSQGSATRATALGSVMSDLLTMQSVGLPCRAMCQAVTSTCSCGAQGADTIGALIAWMGTQPQLSVGIPQPALRVLFKDVWDIPFCELFPEPTTPGWAGYCPPAAAPQQCTQRAEWCTATQRANADASKFVQALLFQQLNRATTGWLTKDNTVLWDVHKEVSTAVSTASSQAADSGQGSSAGVAGGGVWAGQVVGIVFLCLMAVALLGVGAVAAIVWWRQREQRRTYFELAGKENFISLQEPSA